MVRLARAVIPGIPNHVRQRGNGRARTFFEEGDYRFYLGQLAEHCYAAGVSVWAWVLMPNHAHLILTPVDQDGLRRALSRVHRAHAGRIHARLRRTGHFWQGRFGCVAMDQTHLRAALRYVARGATNRMRVALNPGRARLVDQPEDWRWSSVHAQLGRVAGDGVTDTAPARVRYPDFASLLAAGSDADGFKALRQAESTGRLIGDAGFLDRLEEFTGRRLKRAKPGPKPKDN